MIFPYKLHEIGIYYVSVNKKISELRDLLVEEIKEKKNIALDKDFVLVREHFLEKPTKVF